VSECQKIKKGGLDQYGTECFHRLIFATIGKKCLTERVKSVKMGDRRYGNMSLCFVTLVFYTEWNNATVVSDWLISSLCVTDFRK